MSPGVPEARGSSPETANPKRPKTRKLPSPNKCEYFGVPKVSQTTTAVLWRPKYPQSETIMS